MPNTVDFSTYNDMCSDCEKHSQCHGKGINWSKVAGCAEEIETELKNLSCH